MNKGLFAIVGVFIVLLLLNSFFIVNQTEQVIVLQFGKPVEFNDDGKEVAYINNPGLKFKIPFIQQVVRFDKRILYFEAADKEILDSENKTLTVSAFAKYKIIDPLTFYEKVTDLRGINSKLDKIFESSLRDAIGKAPLQTLLTDNRKGIMKEINDSVVEKSSAFGIQVTDVRIVRADLPKENSDAIFQRMYTDRNKEAREYRAQGQEEAQKIVSKAEKLATIIIAEAERDSQIIRGEGDGKATKIFADAFNRDSEFFSFYRSMQAYKGSINKDSTSMVLSPDSEFLGYFGDINGVRKR
ncbi:MAG: protease modulator HflC [Rickettsiales bacterium]|nr:protease modulator HflC [Pseudomonadota bacterium]MDA0966425.1 protease modulator HflC [Pseudomonadota bacterium]MDG4543287.1 protease modulator HflC [Rickettsiales bacterium]MDG4545553.1 protease modulator HflC [Rickettsiales bacterium]MDG4548002.1 protease modulator HflC [Rickettsiales bacterium]